MPAKKNYKKKKKSGGPRKNIVSSTPIQKSQLVKLKYCQRLKLDPANNGTLGADDSLVFRTFRLNSCFDPDYDNTTAGAGEQAAGDANHQPYGFDQWSAFYEHYRVVGAKITVKFWNQNLAHILTSGTDIEGGSGTTVARGNVHSQQGVYVAVHLDNDTQPETTVTHAKETNKYKFRTLLPGHMTQISKTFSLKKWMKQEGSAHEDIDNWGNTTSSNPSQSVFAHLIAAGITTSNIDCMPVDVEIMIDQIVLFTDLKEMDQS